MSRSDESPWPPDEGELSDLIRETDWSAAGLGPVRAWPQSLRTAVEMLLKLPVAAGLLCGPDLVQIYNDGYRSLIGKKHPQGMGQPARQCWPEAWEFTEPVCRNVLRKNQSYTFEDQRMVLDRYGRAEEGFFTLTYAPIPIDGATLVLVTAQEVTDRVRAKAAQAENAILTQKLRHDRNRMLEDLFRLSPSFLFVIRGRESVFEFANPAFYHLVCDRELLGRPASEALPEAWFEGFRECVFAVMDSCQPFVGSELPVTVTREEGAAPETRYLDVIYQPLLEPDGSCVRVLGHGVDVTREVRERQSVQDDLAASRRRFQVLANSLEVIAAASDQDEVFERALEPVRELTGADGAAIVVREDDYCHYLKEDSPRGRLWEGQSFPAGMCLSGWAIGQDKTAVVENIATDERLPPELYEPSWVSSLLMVPLGFPRPFAAIGAYWAQPCRPGMEQVAVLEALARAAGQVIQYRRTESRLRQSEERAAAVFERAPVGLSEIAPDGRFLRVNDELCRILDRSRDNLLSSSVADVTHPDDFRDSEVALGELVATGEPGAVEKRYLRPDGGIVWSRSSLTLLNHPGDAASVIAVTVDLSERVMAEQALRASEERYRTLADLSPDGILVHSGRAIHYANTAAARILGVESGEDLLETSLLKFIDRSERKAVIERNRRLLQEKSGGAPKEERWRRADGSSVDLEISAAPIELDGKSAVQILLRDITGRKLAEHQVWQFANFDTLTGLPNRRLFRDRLDQAVKKVQRSRQKLGLLFIDLDDFKQVNDLLGHDAGDQLLIQAARRLEGCVRVSDTVARPGGDEFTMVLGELDDTLAVEKVAQQIVGALSQPFHLGTEIAYVSASVGITVYPNDATTSKELVRKADQAMYAAKAQGKNQFSYFTHAMDEQAHMRLRLASELRSAVQEGQLEVYYQPVVNLALGCIDKAEALVRWRHPVLGLVEPSTFIPLAEESTLITEIGNWVFSEAAAAAKRWSEKFGDSFQVSVNKSPMQFLARNADEDWIARLGQIELSGKNISVEITEGVLLHASRTVTDRLLEYRDAGIQVAIDDFGTGYSSMTYLKKFDIDYLKIDRSFVVDMAEEESNKAIAESIIVMAHRLGLKVIAEGIETEAQKALLFAAGCDYGQGFLFSRPVPAREFEELVGRGLVQGSY